MIRSTTNEIITACRRTVADYDALCHGFFGAPGHEGIKRRTAFLELIQKLDHYSPDAAFIKLYEFYIKQQKSTRLTDAIYVMLMDIADITPHTFTGDLFYDLDQITRIQQAFEEKVNEVKEDLGIHDHQGDILMTTFKKY